jgi:Tol biopolymer transport system component
VCASSDAGDSDIYVAQMPDGARRIQVSAGSGRAPHWCRNGKEIFYLSNDQKMTAVPVTTKGNDLIFGQPKAIFDLPNIGGARSVYDVSPDGQRFLFQSSDEDPGAVPIRLVQNWPAARIHQ